MVYVFNMLFAIHFGKHGSIISQVFNLRFISDTWVNIWKILGLVIGTTQWAYVYDQSIDFLRNIPVVIKFKMNKMNILGVNTMPWSNWLQFYE